MTEGCSPRSAASRDLTPIPAMRWLGVGAMLALLALGGCKARKTYPDAAPGWHSGDFTVVFGRLQRIQPPATQPNSEPPPPIWTIRFGPSSDVYGGELALTPGDRFIGYTGGESVELRGHLLTQATSDLYSGRWYGVDSIRMWRGHH